VETGADVTPGRSVHPEPKLRMTDDTSTHDIPSHTHLPAPSSAIHSVSHFPVREITAELSFARKS
jgi:hypothetical protein